VRDLQTGITSLVSIDSAGTSSGDDGTPLFSRPRISADGRVVVFESFASNLVPPGVDANGERDVFVPDLATGLTRLVGIDRTGAASGNDLSTTPVLSADGRYVAFESYATNLTAALDANFSADVFVRDVVAATTTLVSVSTAGTVPRHGA